MFTSNRGENTVGIFSASGTAIVAKVGVGVQHAENAEGRFWHALFGALAPGVPGT